ncbi:dimethylaniline monooxygenase [N-oxide-forming] 2-like [Contarinia nasturtii]|uniref:dimethylaniline monooxygenase [N-oxide-forming] 2-like n=1 Tax=Contarinia nasturtii TaxID=265458 RepID=UPI0012D3F031|nr:dimethylaniline monooxygenase [N-oxide-forming] 2-like [Contarinia nasturtii]
MLNIVVIGAGPSGLCSAKYSLAHGYKVTIYEQAGQLGGVWNYTEEVGKNQYGINIHSPMYRDLRTNLPHQVMTYIDHPFPEGTRSFPSHVEVQKYYQSYAERFDFMKLIKFNHSVIRVLPIENNKWEVIVKDCINDKFETIVYDAVFVCNGHYAKSHIPEIPGACEFKGRIMHSRDFRTPEKFHDENVLIIGSGDSALDIIQLLRKTASRITVICRGTQSAQWQKMLQNLLSENFAVQRDVERLTQTGAKFSDGSHQTFSVVIFATGYDYAYPFLSTECGITIDDNFVQPLYKHILNIQYPNMAFIGVVGTFTLDLQVQFVLKFISGAKQLPSKSEMFLDMQVQTFTHWNRGFNKNKTHYLYLHQSSMSEFRNQLSEIAGPEKVKATTVLRAIVLDVYETRLKDIDFRKYKYVIIDDNTFKKIEEL